MTAARAALPRSRPQGLRFAWRGAVTMALLVGGTSAFAHEDDAKGQIEAALARGKIDRAVALGEAEVAKAPQAAPLRAELGHAYLRAGRFEAAASALGDAAALGDTSDRTTLALALAQIASGQNRAALATLDRGQGIAASDLGLALALAGDTGRGVAVLTDALRDGVASPQLRQNLAYAYALDGRWADATLTAGFDLPPDQVSARLQQWAQSMQSGGERLRIARLLQVPVIVDQGMPVALTLNIAVKPAVLAAAEIPALTSANTPVAAALPPVEEAALVEPPLAAPAVAKPAVAGILVDASSILAAPSAALAPSAAHVHAVAGYGHFVQLGAYSTYRKAQQGKLVLAKRYPHLREHGLLIAHANVRGRSYWRVVLASHDGTSAARRCASLKRQGGACFAYAVKPAGEGGALALNALNTPPGRPR